MSFRICGAGHAAQKKIRAHRLEIRFAS
jgi:hypothetical protein